MEKNEILLQHQAMMIKNLEMQIGQIRNLLSQTQPITLLRETEKNLLEHVNAVTLRSETKYEGSKEKEAR